MKQTRHNSPSNPCIATAPPVEQTTFLPARHRERAARIRSATLHLHGLVERGQSLNAALAETIRQHPRRKLQSDPRHYAPLSRGSLIRFYYAYRQKGAAAFQPGWVIRKPAISEGDMIAFLNFATRRRSTRQLATLWRKYCRTHKPELVAAGAPMRVASPLNYFRRLAQRIAQLENQPKQRRVQ